MHRAREQRYEHGLRLACADEDGDLQALASGDDPDPHDAWAVVEQAVA